MKTVTRAAKLLASAAMAVRWWLAAKLGKLYAAARNGHMVAVTALINAGADTNARDEDGNTALHLAVGNGHAQAVTALLNAGADTNARDKDGNTALHLAVGNGHAQAVTALLNADADPDARTKKGLTPLHFAAEHNDNPALVTALLKAKADANAQDECTGAPRCTSQQDGTRTPRSSPPCSMPARLQTHRTHTGNSLSTMRRATGPSTEAKLTGV